MNMITASARPMGAGCASKNRQKGLGCITTAEAGGVMEMTMTIAASSRPNSTLKCGNV